MSPKLRKVMITFGICGTALALVVSWRLMQLASARCYSGPGSVEMHLQTIRGQIDAFKNQHGGNAPLLDSEWTIMVSKSSSTELGDGPSTGKDFGPYLQFPPVNPVNGQRAVAEKPSPNVGWVYQRNGASYTISAVNTTGDAVLSKDDTEWIGLRPEDAARVKRDQWWRRWGL